MASLSGLAGLSGAYPAYQQADSNAQDITKKRLANQDAMSDVAGQQAFGRALQLLFQGGGGAPMGPQPAPGQPSAPAGGPMPQGPAGSPMQLPPAGGPPGMPPSQQGGSPMGGGGQMPPMAPGGGQPPQRPPMAAQPGPGGQPRPALDLQSVIGAIVKSNPGAPPNVIAAAVNRFLPVMNAQAQTQWREMSLLLREQQIQNMEQWRQQQGARADQRVEQGQERVDQGNRRLDISAGESKRKAEQGDRRLAQGDKRLDLAAQELQRKKLQDAVRNDQKLQQMQQQADRYAQQRDIARTRTVLSAMHMRAIELIQAWGASNSVDQKTIDAILEENRKMFREKIDELSSGDNPDADRK